MSTSSNTAPSFRVAITGAGVGGLALAVTIGKYSDIPIDLYEAGPEITTVGAGIAMPQRTLSVISELGLDEELRSRGVPNQDSTMAFRRADQAEEGHTFFRHSFSRGILMLHRTDVVNVLNQHLPKTCAVHLSKRLTHYTHSQTSSGPAITLHFSDGTTAETDVLIGADGVRSATRATMYELLAVKSDSDPENLRQFKDPIWSGTLAYRCLVPVEKLSAIHPNHPALRSPVAYCGKEKHVISYPISQGRLLNLIGFCTVRDGEGTIFQEKWVVDTPPQEVIDIYQGWEPELQTLLQFVVKPSRWAVHVVYSLPFFVSNHVAILGDAAHAMTTHLGAGAGQAIEDAYILGRVLTHPLTAKENVSHALNAYQESRLPFTNSLAQDARTAGLLYEFSAPGFYDGMDRVKEKEGLEGINAGVTTVWEWEVKIHIDEQWDRAEKILEEKLQG